MLINKPRLPYTEILTIGILPQFLKKLIYRIKGYKIGKKVTFGFGSVIVGQTSVEIGDNSNFGFFSVIRGREIKIDRFVKIGAATIIDTNKIEIHDDTKINEQVFIGGMAGPDSSLEIGKRCTIMQLSFINTYLPVKIGDDTGIGGHCLLFTHGSWLSQLEGYPVKFAPITIGNNVWLPWRVFILPGVKIGDNVVISADSLVSKEVPSNCIAAGSPAKIINKKFPGRITEQQRGEYFAEILNEFERYMIFHDFRIQRTHDTAERMLIERKGIFSEIIITQENASNLAPIHSDNLLILDNVVLDPFDKRFKMIIDLQMKERIGSSDVGEEFIAFISRYGVRFNRID